MDSYDQSSVPRHDSAYPDPPPYHPYEPPPQAHPRPQNLEPQQPSSSHRLSQNYQAYQAYQPQVDQDKHNQDQQYQQFLQWQQFMQFQQTQHTHQTMPVQQPQQPQQAPLPQSPPVGWQNPYITHSDIYPSNVHTPSHPQTPISPHGHPPAPMPPPSPFSTPNQYVPPPPAPQFSVPYQTPPHSVTPPVFPNLMTSHTAGYLAPPLPPTQSPLPAHPQYSHAPDIPSKPQASVTQEYPAPLFSAPTYSTNSTSTPPLSTPQCSSATPPPPAPQPSAPPQASAAQSPAPQYPASFPPQPENLIELRERLESAGIPDETIAAVLLQHASLGKTTIPSAEETPLAQGEKERLSESGSAPSELPPRLPPRPSLPTSTSSSTSIPQSLITEKIKFNIYLAGTSKRSIQPVNTHHVEPDDSSQYQRSYITNFTADTFQGNKEPQLRIYRKDPENPNPNAPPQISQCRYHRSEWSQKVEIKDIWRSGSAKWEPELETWKSEAGTCAGQALQWQYDASRGGESLDTYVIRCATMIPRPPKKNSDTSVQAGAQSTGTPVEVEVCRVVIKDGDRARIEIPKVVMIAGKEVEQTEELVCNALVQFFRKRAGWMTKRAMRAVSRVDGSQVNTYLQTTNNALKVVGFFSGNN